MTDAMPITEGAKEAGNHHDNELRDVQAIQRIANLGSWMLDLRTNTLHWSDEMHRLYGADRAAGQASPQNYLARVHPDDIKLTDDAFAQTIATSKALDFVHRVVEPQGLTRYIRVRGEVDRLPDGQPWRAIGTAQDISAEYVTGQALRASEERLRGAFSAMSEGLVLQSRDGRVIDANAAAETILGLSRNELLGRTSTDARWRAVRADGSPLPGGEHPAMVTLRTGMPLRAQMMGVEDPLRGRRWISVTSMPIFGLDPVAPESVVSTFVDVTDRRQIEAQLAEANARLQDLYDHAPCGYYSINPSGLFENINATQLAWLGCSREDVIGKLGPKDFFTEAGKTLFDESFPGYLATGQIDGLEFDLVSRNGRIRRVSVSATAVRDQAGRFVRSRSVMFDVTELRKVERALREMTHEQQAMLDNDLIGIVKLRNRRAVWKNRALNRIFGYTPGELLGAPSRILYRDDVSYQEIGDAMYPIVRAGGHFQAQLEMVRKDGTPVWIDMNGVLLSAERNEVLVLLADITPLKEAEQVRTRSARLEAENRQLQETSRLKGLLLSNLSHELRTPLHAIMGFVQLLQTGSVTPASARYPEFLGYIGTSGQHLLELIESMLDFAQAESGKISFHPQPVHLETVIKEITDIHSAEAQRKEIAIVSRVDLAVKTVHIDRLRLQQVLANYLSNAIKFTPVKGLVTISAEPEGEASFRIQVQDNGIGIAAKDLPRLFTEFDQLSSGPSKQFGGTGMGLALTRSLVEAQGGSVGVRSAPGEGSVFHAILPRVHTAAETPQAVPQRPGG